MCVKSEAHSRPGMCMRVRVDYRDPVGTRNTDIGLIETRKDHIHRLKLDGDRARDKAAVIPRATNRRDHTDAIGNLVDHPYVVVGARIHGDGPQSDWNLGEQTGTGWRRYVEHGK